MQERRTGKKKQDRRIQKRRMLNRQMQKVEAVAKQRRRSRRKDAGKESAR